MKNLLTWNFWFNLRPEPLIPTTQKIFIITLIAFAFIAFLIALFKKRASIYRGFYKSLYSFFFINTVIGLTLFFFNYEMIPFFSARFWLALWFLTMLVWLFFILKKLKKIPLTKEENKKEEEIKKYLP
ncbi:hypothetical protein GX917_02210 [Candidatus Falkowbacteria bacterium]|jgi:hypothetical protein|nr:hypothetical protein [Candidatus Falkowbacteria bacterium]